MEGTTIVSSFLKQFLTPQFIGSLQSPFDQTPLRIHYFSDIDKPAEIIELKNVYPFMTLQDLKTLIYMQKGESIDFFPSFQSLLVPISAAENTEEGENTQSQYYLPLDYTWMSPGGTKREDIYSLINPLIRAKSPKVDVHFVTSSGAKREVKSCARTRSTIEDIFTNVFESMKPTIHLFLYKDAYAGVNPALRISEREWYGRLGPYFPEISPTQPLDTLMDAQKQVIAIRIAYVKRSLQLLGRIDSLLQEDTPLFPVSLTGVKYLRLIWTDTNKETPSLESLFYQLPVTQTRPFLRIVPSDTQAITKLRLQGVLKIPDISDPKLLLQWAQEKNPTPDKEFLFAKIVVRKTMGTQPAFYGTLRMLEDGSADFIVMPPKQLRQLDPKSDLLYFSDYLLEAIKDTPLNDTQINIGEATIVCGIRMSVDSKAVTKSMLKKRLPAFSVLFQEIPHLPGEEPLAMLRYKCVSNFATEDRIYSFLTQLSSRRILKGEMVLSEMVEAVADEFQLTIDDAQKKVADWLKSKGEAITSVPESCGYKTEYNPGIDIAIFAQHPYYSFHIYRVDSAATLERIITSLSLMFSIEDAGEVEVPAEIVKDYTIAQDAVTVVTPGAELGEEGKVAGIAAAEPLPEGAEATDMFSSADNLEMFGELMFEEGYEDGVNVGDAFATNALQAAPRFNLEKAVKESTATAQKDIESALAFNVAKPTVAKAAAPAPAPAPNTEDEDEGTGKKKTYAKYLIHKLQQADSRLFSYKSPSPDVEITQYVTMCQATETRQPAVLNQEQYERMREIYADDDIAFLVYPLEQDDPIPEEGTETYTVLKYGSDPLRQNYYLCCEYFCVKDYILVREKDFKSNMDRSTPPKAKPVDSCPFCHGLLIKTLKSPAKNETVIQRKIKKKSKDDKRHLYVRFLKDTPHPEGFYLPCCFTENKILRISDREFEHIRAAAQVVPTKRGEEEEEPVSAATGTALPMLDYAVTIAKAHKKYIVGPEKFPLKLGDKEGPQIGLLPAILDEYFNQNPRDFVSREFNRMELKPESQAFLRIGVENRSAYLNDSFFACIAPYLDYRNSAAEVKERLMEVITPRIFLFLNFGNLVLEFYDPTDPLPTEGVLRLWATKELEIEMNQENKDAIIRLWKSYTRFMGFINSSGTLKEYRQFAQALALPNLLTPRGIVFVVLDILENGKLEVRCPPFGYDMEQYAVSDIAFIMHHHSGVWEPIFYTDNRPAMARFPERHEPTMRFQRAIEASWPTIVRRRIQEFVTKCSSSGRGAFTSQSRIDSYAMLPLAKAIQALGQSSAGIVRDSYNHVAALTYRTSGGKSRFAAVPVVDDGTIVRTKWLHLDWDDYTPSPMEEIIEFYKDKVTPNFGLYPGYRIARRVKSRGAGKYVALQLANGIFIPSGPPKDESAVSSLPLVEVDEMEWLLNREIIFSGDNAISEEQLLKAEESEMNETFEHLRLTFSNWFSSEKTNGEMRTQIKNIIERKDLPLYEKRKRLLIHLENTIINWMNTEGDVPLEVSSLLRVDCRLLTQPTCTGRCVWRQGTEAENTGRCYLHSPKETRLGSRKVNGPHLLVLRLIEELLRFPERRRQLLEDDVTELVNIKDAIRIGDQWILPENSVAWYDLLRLDWIVSNKERKRFFEEMSRAGEEIMVNTTKRELLPEALRRILGETDPKTGRLILYRGDIIKSEGGEESPFVPFLAPLGLIPSEIGLSDTDSELTTDALKKIVSHIRQPVVQINLRVDPPAIIYNHVRKNVKSNIPYIFVITSEGPTLLSTSAKIYQALKVDDMPEGILKIYKTLLPPGTLV